MRGQSDIAGFQLGEVILHAPLADVHSARRGESDPAVILQVATAAARPGDLERLEHGYALAGRLAASGVVVAPSNGPSPARTPGLFCYDDDGSRPLAALREQFPLPLRAALHLAIALTRAIGSIHRSGVTHRGLSEHTVWTQAGSAEVRLFDFSNGSTFARSDAGFREAVPMSGDLRYLAPEQSGRTNRVVDYRCDFYAAGVVMFQVLSGRLPFDGEDPLDLVHSHIAKHTPLLHEVAAVPESIGRVVAKLLSKNAEDRYQSASGLRADLERCLEAVDSGHLHSTFELGTRETIELLQLPKAFYGRQGEFDTLRDLFETVATGESRLVLVSGPTGVGKSRFVSELEGPANAMRGRYLSGKFDQYKRNIPYFAIAQAFRVLVAQLLGEGERELEAWRKKIADVVKGNGQVLLDVLPDLELVLGPQPAVQALAPVEARNRFNQVLRDFVRLFARRGQPLCLVLDDLQWADPASLGLIHTLVNDPQSTHLLVVGIYRDAELARSPGLQQFIEHARGSSVPVSHIALHGLAIADVQALVRDAFGCGDERAAGLAALLQRRTEGNALFMIHLIQFLYEEGLIYFDEAARGWTWSVADIDAKGITETVLDLMTGRISGLSKPAKRAVKVAACLGSDFDLASVAAAAAMSAAACLSALEEAIDAGLLLRSGGDSAAAGVAHAPEPGLRIRFLHDRVQQAAYALIPERARTRWHLVIGRRLWRGLSEDEVSDRLFELLSNLNPGAALVGGREERLRLAALNRLAGGKARESLAHEDALRFVLAGINLLPDDAWDSEYELCFDLHRHRFECEYQLGNPEAAATLVEALLRNARSDVDRAAVYYTRILLDTGIADYPAAVTAGAEALSFFGISYPAAPREWHLMAQLAAVKCLTFRRKPMDFLKLPEMQRSEHKAAARILMSLLPAAYFTSPNLLMLTGLKIVTLSLRHGNSSASAPGYVLYGLGIGTALRQYRLGYEFGRVAVDLAARYGDVAVRCKALVIFGGFVNLWRDSIASSIGLLTEAYDVALQAGDFQYANYAILQIIFLNFSRGAPLAHVLAECRRYEHFVVQTKDDFAIDNHRHWSHAAHALQGDTEGPYSLDKDGYREADALARFRTSNVTTLCYYHVLKLQLAYLAGAYREALNYAGDGACVIDSAPGQIVVVDFHFYYGLTCAALLRAGAEAQAHAAPDAGTLRRTLAGCSRRMARWARNCPQNFECHDLLLRAEIEELGGRFLKAAAFYEKAYAVATAQAQHCLGALAAELSGFAHRRQGLGTASESYFEKAQACYAAWGASVPLERLERLGAVARTRARASTAPPESGAKPVFSVAPLSGDAFDLASITRIARAVAGESDLKRLLETMTGALLEAAGAGRAVFLLVRAGAVSIESESPAAPVGGVQSGDSGNPAVSMRIVNYVLRTKADVLLGDAVADARFNSCPYIRTSRPRSLLCTPVLKQGEVVGVIYLENNLATNAFTPGCLKLTQMIGTEIAFAVDNARVGHELAEKNTALRHALQKVDNLEMVKTHLSKFVPRSLQERIDENPAAPDFEKHDIDVSVLFLDVAGYTRISEALDRASVTWLIERYFSSFLDDVYENGGDVNHSAGDGLMVIFRGGDASQHAVRAVRTAIAIRRKADEIGRELTGRFPPLLVNIGINSGTCSVGSTKLKGVQGDYWTFTASGSVTNQAARLASHALNGSILVSDETATRVAGVIDLESLGAVQFKNVGQPMFVHKVVGESVS